jgi:hypothetical protein
MLANARNLHLCRNAQIDGHRYGRKAIVVSHGLVKERMVPPAELELALWRKVQFESNPRRHTHEE